MHPGGATILTGAERALAISPEHMRASYDTYINHGNSSSATVFNVLDRMRAPDMDAVAPHGRPRNHIVGCAFGPGITVEMCMLRRNFGSSGLQTPPETESEASRSEAGEEVGRAREQVPEVAELKAAGASEGDGPGLAAAAETQTREVLPAEAEASILPELRRVEPPNTDAKFISEALEGVELD
jgi:fungal type III polyketide synthase